MLRHHTRVVSKNLNQIDREMKNTKLCFRSALIVTMATLIYSCRTDEPLPLTDDSFTQEMSILGKKLEIPFTVENMQKAYDNLVTNSSVNNPNARTGGLEEDLIVEASHYYYRFLPKDSLEFETLQQDTVLDVSNILSSMRLTP